MQRALGISVLTLLSIAGCGASSQSGDSNETLVSEALPLPPHEEAAAEEEGLEAPMAVEPMAEEPGSHDGGPDAAEPACTLEPGDPAVREQLRRFHRWLRDQSVGRRLTVIAVDALCGDRGGYLTLELSLEGPAGGLQSLSRALTNYYPGSSWEALEYERLPGEDVPLRLDVEVRLPVGASPRPRCEWDPALDCEPAAAEPAAAEPAAVEPLE